MLFCGIVSPASLTQSWSCAAAANPKSSNRGRWCDQAFDRLLREGRNTGAAPEGTNVAPATLAGVRRLLKHLRNGGCSGMRYELLFERETRPGDDELEFDGLRVVVNNRRREIDAAGRGSADVVV